MTVETSAEVRDGVMDLLTSDVSYGEVSITMLAHELLLVERSRHGRRGPIEDPPTVRGMRQCTPR